MYGYLGVGGRVEGARQGKSRYSTMRWMYIEGERVGFSVGVDAWVEVCGSSMLEG